MLDHRERPWLELDDLLAGAERDAAWARLVFTLDVLAGVHARMRVSGGGDLAEVPPAMLTAIVRAHFGRLDPAMLVDAARPEVRRDFDRLVSWARELEAASGAP